MSKNLKSSWEEQDGAFLGKNPIAKIGDAGIAVQTHLTERAVTNVLAIQRDLAYAKLVQENEDEGTDTCVFERDMDLARKLQDEERGLADPQTLQGDLALARKLQEEEEGGDKLTAAKHPPADCGSDLELAFKLEDQEKALKEEEYIRARSGQQRGLPKPKRPHSRSTSNGSTFPGETSDEKTCVACKQPARYYIQALDMIYHPQCFICMGCHEVIKADDPIACHVGDNGERNPLHRQCYAELFGMKCIVCAESIPMDSEGKISFVKHPFFSDEHMCPKHSNENRRRCTGCYRYEPIVGGFADLGDGNRCVCMACCRTVIVDSAGAKPLWDRVMNFFEHGLKVPIWKGMSDVPVLIVSDSALNEQLNGTAHSGAANVMTRGLCLSEHQCGHQFEIPNMRFNMRNSSFIPNDEESKGHTFFQIPDALTTHPESSVTAILCLSGLPLDLTASILAHEATHAWIKLHPNFTIRKPIPKQVEEGCCQLVAMLFLTDGLPPTSKESDNGEPSDDKLRQFFKFSIETDTNEIYGEGYRKAAKAYANLGIEALLSHVVRYQEIPIV